MTSLREATKETGSRFYFYESWRLFSQSDSHVRKFEWFQSNIKFLANGESLHLYQSVLNGAKLVFKRSEIIAAEVQRQINAPLVVF